MGFPIRPKDIIDILLVTILLYQSYKLLKNSGAGNVFLGILAFIIAWFLVSFVFELELLSAIFNRVMSVGAIALIVIFQDEIRTFFSRIGSHSSWKHLRLFSRLFRSKKHTEQSEKYIIPIVMACKNMAKTKTGALIVFVRKQDLHQYALSGENIDAVVSSRLIENIFFKNTPLHDGALLVAHGKLSAAACVLPVSRNMQIPKHFGLRHRAALGICEKSDAIAVVVSEETGTISYAIGEQIVTNVKPEELERMLSEELSR